MQKLTSITDQDFRHHGFRIRRMRPSDIQSFVEIGLPTCAFMHGRQGISEEKMQQDFSGFVSEYAFADNSEIYVAEDLHGHHVGQLWLHVTRNRFNGLREMWIWDITVRKEFRHKGLGKQLLEFSKVRAAANNIEEIWLLVSSVNDAAIQLYRSSGLCNLGQLMCFQVAGQVPLERGIMLGATMLRPLASNDVEGLIELWSAADLPFRPHGRDSTARLRAFLSSAHEAGWCASATDHLIGAALISEDGRKGWIERLAVHPDFRRVGLAKALVTACRNSLRARGTLVIGALIEKENHVSRALFENCGFVNHHDICYYSHREDKEN